MEQDGLRGGNEVASMLWRELDLRGLLDGGESVSEINFVFDNCPGQNKNRMVLRMLPVLINL